MDCQKPLYDPLGSPFNFCVNIVSFLVSMIRFLFVLGNFLEGPSLNHFCDIGTCNLIKDSPHNVTLLKPNHRKANGYIC